MNFPRTLKQAFLAHENIAKADTRGSRRSRFAVGSATQILSQDLLLLLLCRLMACLCRVGCDIYTDIFVTLSEISNFFLTTVISTNRRNVHQQYLLAFIIQKTDQWKYAIVISFIPQLLLHGRSRCDRNMNSALAG